MHLRDWSLITGRGGGTKFNGKIAGLNHFATPPPPSRQGNTFRAALLKGGNFVQPIQYGLNFKLPHKNNPKTVCAPPLFFFLVGVKLHLSPSRFVAPPFPLSVTITI